MDGAEASLEEKLRAKLIDKLNRQNNQGIDAGYVLPTYSLDENSATPLWDFLQERLQNDPLSDLFFNNMSTENSQSGSSYYCLVRIVINHIKFERNCDVSQEQPCKEQITTQVLNHFNMFDLQKFSDFTLLNFMSGASFAGLLAKLLGEEGMRYEVIEAPNSVNFSVNLYIKPKIYGKEHKVKPPILIPDLDEVVIAKESLAKIHMLEWKEGYCDQLHLPPGEINVFNNQKKTKCEKKLFFTATNHFSSVSNKKEKKIEPNNDLMVTGTVKEVMTPEQRDKLFKLSKTLDASGPKPMPAKDGFNLTPAGNELIVTKTDNINAAGGKSSTNKPQAVRGKPRNTRWDNKIDQFTRTQFHDLYGDEEVTLPISQLHHYATTSGYKIKFDTKDIENKDYIANGNPHVTWSQVDINGKALAGIGESKKEAKEVACMAFLKYLTMTTGHFRELWAHRDTHQTNVIRQLGTSNPTESVTGLKDASKEGEMYVFNEQNAVYVLNHTLTVKVFKSKKRPEYINAPNPHFSGAYDRHICSVDFLDISAQAFGSNKKDCKCKAALAWILEYERQHGTHSISRLCHQHDVKLSNPDCLTNDRYQTIDINTGAAKAPSAIYYDYLNPDDEMQIANARKKRPGPRQRDRAKRAKGVHVSRRGNSAPLWEQVHDEDDIERMNKERNNV